MGLGAGKRVVAEGQGADFAGRAAGAAHQPPLDDKAKTNAGAERGEGQRPQAAPPAMALDILAEGRDIDVVLDADRGADEFGERRRQRQAGGKIDVWRQGDAAVRRHRARHSDGDLHDRVGGDAAAPRQIAHHFRHLQQRAFFGAIVGRQFIFVDDRASGVTQRTPELGAAEVEADDETALG